MSHYMHYLEGSLDIHSHVHGTVIRCLWPLGLVEEGTEQATQRRIIVVYRIKISAIQPTWATPSGIMSLSTPFSSENHAYGALLQSGTHQASRGLTGAWVDVVQGAGSLFGFLSGYELASILAKPTSAARGSESKLPSTNPVDHQLAGHPGIKPLWALASSPSTNLFCDTAFNRSPASFELSTLSDLAKLSVRSVAEHLVTSVIPTRSASNLAGITLNRLEATSLVSEKTRGEVAQAETTPSAPAELTTIPPKGLILTAPSGLKYYPGSWEKRVDVGLLRLPAWTEPQVRASENEFVQLCFKNRQDLIENIALYTSSEEVTDEKYNPDPDIRQAAYCLLDIRRIHSVRLDYFFAARPDCELDDNSAYNSFNSYDPDAGISTRAIKGFSVSTAFKMSQAQDNRQRVPSISSPMDDIMKVFQSLSSCTGACFQGDDFLSKVHRLLPALASELPGFNMPSRRRLFCDYFGDSLDSLLDNDYLRGCLEDSTSSVEAALYFTLHTILKDREVDVSRIAQAWENMRQGWTTLQGLPDGLGLEAIMQFGGCLLSKILVRISKESPHHSFVQKALGQCGVILREQEESLLWSKTSLSR